MDETMEAPPAKRRCSILKLPEKRLSRETKAVSFNERCFFKNLDGSCEISRIFLQEEMEITFLDLVEPIISNNNNNTADHQRGDSDMEISGYSTMSEVLREDPDKSVSASTISSFNTASLRESFLEETFYGAFHESNNTSTSTGADTFAQNIEALNDCLQDIDKATEENRRKLDEEMAELFKFYRHIVNKDNRYEFALSIFGLRHSLWIIIKVDPQNYPHEKLHLRFAVNRKDRHLYPFYEFAESVRRTTQEGRGNYLTRFVFNAQKFRRFLRTLSKSKV